MIGRAVERVFAVGLLLMMTGAVRTDASPLAVVRWEAERQVIEGFGASCADSLQPLPEKMADFFFTTSGIGLSLLRVQVIPSFAECKNYDGEKRSRCVNTPSGATILTGELAIAQQAVRRGVRVWSAPWTPPAAMKSNHSLTHGGHLLPQFYNAWARSLAAFVSLLNANGVPIYAMSVQNEPDMSTDYPSAIFTGQEFHDFVPHLRSALDAGGAADTKIIIAEQAHWDFYLTSPTMADPVTAKDIGILAAHGYGWNTLHAPDGHGLQLWQTEDSSQEASYNGDMADALRWASKIHAFLTVAQVNAWHWWFLSDGSAFGNGTDNAALTDYHLHYPRRAYVTGQWSKFVRPGWKRVDVSYSGPLEISAFNDPSGRDFAIVVINSNRAGIRQTIDIGALNSLSVVPWITSESKSLAPQPPITVVQGKFTWDIPGQSVVTFVGSTTVPSMNLPHAQEKVAGNKQHE
jgi:glucuronoarabinoxylan endo-1,4-beta-xylanase